MRELTKRQSEIYDYIKHIVQTKVIRLVFVR